MRTRSEIISYYAIIALVIAALANLIIHAVRYDKAVAGHISIDTTQYWYKDNLHFTENPDSLAEMIAVRIYTNPNYTKHKQINPKQLDSLQRLRLMLITK